MKHLLNYTCRCLLSLVAMIAVSLSASAQSDLLGSGTKVFSATGTLDGTYTTTYQDAKSSGMPMSKDGTSALDVVSSTGVKVGAASVTLSGFDVTFTINGSTAQSDGSYSFTVPENYFSVYNFINGRNYGCSADKFTINLTGMGGGTDGGEGGGGTQGGGEDGDGGGTGTGTQPLNVTFDFSHGFVAEKDGVTCESDGEPNSVFGWQLKTDKHITFTAPYGYLISQIVVKDGSGYNNNYYTEIDGGDWSAGNTWTGSASSVTLTSYYNSRLTTATITLVKDPNAKELFAFTSATPAAGTELEKLETFTLALPAGTTGLTGLGSTISVNGDNTSVSASVNSDGTGLVITLDKAIVTDGSYTIVVPREFATAGSGAINSEYTVQYTVNSPVFELTADNFSPKPGDDIEIDLANGQVFKAVNVIYPAGITLREGTVAFRIDGAKVSGTFTAYDGRGLLSFEANSITKSGNHTFDFPAGAFTSTTGKTSTAFTLTYEVGMKHNKYKVLLTAGDDAMPADATITVAGADYKSGDVISVTTVLAESDVTDTDVEGFIFKGVEITQPQTVEINNNKVDFEGAVIVTYEKIIPRVEYTEITPAAEVNLDERNFGSICIKFPENFSTDYTVAPTGFSFTNPAGQQITLSTPYGFTGWSSGTDLYINFPGQHTPGTYTLDIPEDAITFVSGLKNKAIHFEWTLSAKFFVFERYDGETVKKFTEFSLQIPEGVTISECNVTKLQRAVGRDEETFETIYEEVAVTTALTSSAVTFTFATPFTQKESVNLILPEGAITATDGRKNREVSIYQNVDPTEYIDIVSTTPESYVTVDGPFTSIVLNLGSELDPAKVTFGETIRFNGNTDLPVTASIEGTQLTLTFDDSYINYGSNNNSFLIPEGFITTIDRAISRSVGIYNVWINAPKLPLELSGIQMGWDGDVVTTSGAKVEQVGVLLVQFPENVALAEDADLNAITVTDGNGSPCQLYMNGDVPNIYVTNGNQLFVWVNPTMTEIGTYTLHIPAGLLVGEESGNVNAEINFELVIADIDTFVPATSIADGDEVDTLTELVLTASADVTFSHFTGYPANFFYLTGEGVTGDGKVYNAATVSEDGKTATLKLGNIKKNGEYTITIPKGYLRSTTPNEGNAEIVIRVTVDHKVLDWDANDNGIVEVRDVDAAVSAALERGYYGMGGSSDDDPALKALDLNNDGEITIGEIAKLIEQLQPAK